MSFRPVNHRPSQVEASENKGSASVAVSTVTQVSPSDTAVSYPLQKQTSSHSGSQATIHSSNSTESMRVFTPPIIERSASNGAASSGQGSSQESQLLQLSQLAAVQEKMPDFGARSSVKRTADGAIKDARSSPTASPPRPSSHSRNVSGVSAASTTSSHFTDVSPPRKRSLPYIRCPIREIATDASWYQLSWDLKTRLTYAMVKVQHGWQSRTIDEVETLASRAGSPASSNSTIAGRARSSASPKVGTLHRSTPPGFHPQPVSRRSIDGAVRGTSASPREDSPSSRLQVSPSLAPPVSIQPHRNEPHPRRNSDPKYTPSFLAPRSHHDSPHTPAVASLHITPTNRNLSAAANPMVISPTHNNREKDAMEALLFMSSPGNSANMKTYQPGPQPMSSLRNGATSAPSSQRKPLPKSAPKRKGLPNGRPVPSSQPLPASHAPQKRVGFGTAPVHPTEMDLDDPTSPPRHAAYARPALPTMHKVNGLSASGKHPLPSSGGLRKPERARQRLSLEHLDEVLDRVAAEDDSSDSEGEILLPARRQDLGTRY